MKRNNKLEDGLSAGNSSKVSLCQHDYSIASLEFDIPLKDGGYITFMPTYCTKCHAIDGFPSDNFRYAREKHAWSDKQWNDLIKKLKKAADGQSVKISYA